MSNEQKVMRARAIAEFTSEILDEIFFIERLNAEIDADMPDYEKARAVNCLKRQKLWVRLSHGLWNDFCVCNSAAVTVYRDVICLSGRMAIQAPPLSTRPPPMGAVSGNTQRQQRRLTHAASKNEPS